MSSDRPADPAAGGGADAPNAAPPDDTPPFLLETRTAAAAAADAAVAVPVAPPSVRRQPVVRYWTWRRILAEIFSWLKTLISAAVYATFIVTFGFQVARVDGMSMAPTLENHDRLIVDKMIYLYQDPKPGNIVMLYYPLNPKKMFVKRVIATEGQTIRIIDGQVYINNVLQPDKYVLPKYRSHDDFGPELIPKGYDFVMGDHRDNSSDSRDWGFVPKKYIVGKVVLRWWPVDHFRVF